MKTNNIADCLGILEGFEIQNPQESFHNKTTEKRSHNYHSCCLHHFLSNLLKLGNN